MSCPQSNITVEDDASSTSRFLIWMPKAYHTSGKREIKAPPTPPHVHTSKTADRTMVTERHARLLESWQICLNFWYPWITPSYPSEERLVHSLSVKRAVPICLIQPIIRCPSISSVERKGHRIRVWYPFVAVINSSKNFEFNKLVFSA